MDVMSVMESMGTGDIALLAAFFIGLMMAISPCPLAQNITAIAYVSKRIDNSRHTIAVGILYTLGRMVTYVAIASLIVFFGLNVQAIALPLEAYADKLLGPFLIVIGIFMLDLVRFSLPGNRGTVSGAPQAARGTGIYRELRARDGFCTHVLSLQCGPVLWYAHPSRPGGR